MDMVVKKIARMEMGMVAWMVVGMVMRVMVVFGFVVLKVRMVVRMVLGMLMRVMVRGW